MFPRAALVVLALIILITVITGVRFFSSSLGFFKASRDEMNVGATYMRSLRETDVQRWIQLTQRLLAEHDPHVDSIGVYGLGGKPIPPDLQQLKIIRIDISPHQVRYVWMGGIGPRTDLEVHRLPDGSFTLTAHYSDTDSEVIWPKPSNHSMKPTTPLRSRFSVIVSIPCRRLCLSRWTQCSSTVKQPCVG
jgi:hypothetical protein